MAELRLIGAKGDAHIPPPSPAEQNLQNVQAQAVSTQSDIASKQYAEQQALAPLQYSAMHVVKTTDPTTGAISFRKMTPDEITAQQTPEEQQAAQITQLANTREIAALKGNLPVDPSVEADLQRSQDQLKEQLSRKLGAGAEGSDAWNRAMAEFDRQANSLRYAVRTGQMTTADALATNRVSESMGRQEQTYKLLQNATNPYSVSAANMSSVAGTAGAAWAPLQQERFSAADLAMQGSRARNAFWGNIIGGGLSAAGSVGAASVAACWIAEVLYGKDSWRTHLLRYWLNHVWAKESLVGAVFVAAYRKWGRQIAAWLAENAWAQPVVRSVFDHLLQKAIKQTFPGICMGGSYG
jgi:hypothetical protein